MSRATTCFGIDCGNTEHTRVSTLSVSTPPRASRSVSPAERVQHLKTIHNGTRAKSARLGNGETQLYVPSPSRLTCIMISPGPVATDTIKPAPPTIIYIKSPAIPAERWTPT